MLVHVGLQRNRESRRQRRDQLAGDEAGYSARRRRVVRLGTGRRDRVFKPSRFTGIDLRQRAVSVFTTRRRD